MSKNTLYHIQPRLKMLYDMMPPCSCLGDVGTDHGFLPVYCVQNGKCARAIASDIRQGPLQIAEKNIALYQCKPQIQTLLCAGLEGRQDKTCGVIVIAGMGGYTICNILQAWLEQCEASKDFPGNPLFLLQPNTAEPVLRQFLWERGFRIEEERAVQDGAHVYLALRGRFTNTMEPYVESDCYTGKIMGGRRDPNDLVYFTARLRKYTKMLAGLSRKRELAAGSSQKKKLYQKVVQQMQNIVNQEARK